MWSLDVRYFKLNLILSQRWMTCWPHSPQGAEKLGVCVPQDSWCLQSGRKTSTFCVVVARWVAKQVHAELRDQTSSTWSSTIIRTTSLEHVSHSTDKGFTTCHLSAVRRLCMWPSYTSADYTIIDSMHPCVSLTSLPAREKSGARKSRNSIHDKLSLLHRTFDLTNNSNSQCLRMYIAVVYWPCEKANDDKTVTIVCSKTCQRAVPF